MFTVVICRCKAHIPPAPTSLSSVIEKFKVVSSKNLNQNQNKTKKDNVNCRCDFKIFGGHIK